MPFSCPGKSLVGPHSSDICESWETTIKWEVLFGRKPCRCAVLSHIQDDESMQYTVASLCDGSIPE